MTLLQAGQLEKHAGGRRLWQAVSLNLSKGQRLMVQGPSGTGKSLLLRALAGLDALESGTVIFQGKAQSAWAMPAYRARVMYLPQRAALTGPTVEDALRQPFSLKVHQARRYEAATALSLLADLGRAPDFLAKATAHLSGGETQLAALVRALLLGPSVLLLDEATSALDADTTACAEALLLNWLSGGERALVMVSHDASQRKRLGTAFLDVTLGGAPLTGQPV